jgi:hypothetical protein
VIFTPAARARRSAGSSYLEERIIASRSDLISLVGGAQSFFPTAKLR